MGVVEGLVEWAVSALSRMGLAGVCALMALELLIPPIPGEAVMALAGFLAGRGEVELWQAVAAGTFGTVVGALAQYLLGAKVARPALVRLGRYVMFSERDLEAAEELFRRRGFLAVVLGRLVPGVRSVISIAAGVVRMSASAFLAATLAGSLPWNAAFAYAGYVLGENWYIVRAYSDYIDAAGALIVSAAAAYALLRLAGRARCRRGCSSRTSSAPRGSSGRFGGGT